MCAHGDIHELSDGYWPTKRTLEVYHVGLVRVYTYAYIYVRLLTRLLAVRLRGVTQPRSERNNAGVRAFSRRFFVRAIETVLFVTCA